MSEEKRKPWFVAKAVVESGTVLERVEDTPDFATQADADAWIKENIPEGPMLMSVRMGAKFQVTRKVMQV